MIRKLKGRIDTTDTDSVILDVGGVGYGVFCSAHTLRSLPAQGEFTSLLIETHVREDHIHLYGFATEEEQECFGILLKVNGVGVRMALTILSVLTPSQLALALASQDSAALRSVSGVGPKLASRILTELKDAFGATFAGKPATAQGATASMAAQNSAINDAISALVNLGYGRSDAYNAITRIAAQNDNAGVDVLIRQGLKELARA